MSKLWSHRSFKLKTNKLITAGFTLIELLVVIAIISVLSSIVLASLSSARQKAAIARSSLDFRTVNNAIQLYYHENGDYPPAGGTISVDTANDANWSAFMNSLRPYVPQDVLPVFDSIKVGNTVYQGYMYTKTNGSTVARWKIWNGVTGDFVACLNLTKGYMISFAMPKQSSVSLNDGGLDPDGIDRVEGVYSISYNLSDCNF